MTDKVNGGPPPDEVAVTDVSDEVLEELSNLFGAPKHGVVDATDDLHDVTPPLGSTTESTPVDSTTTDSMDGGSTGTGVVVPIDPGDSAVIVIEDVPSTPVDPLLASMSMSDIVGGKDDAGTVVIVDDEVDRVVIVDDDRPDPTFEERQKRRARRERLKRVKWVKVTAFTVVTGIAVLAVMASPLFAIRSVSFEGAVYTADASVESARKALEGRSVFTVDTSQAREALLADPWVADVRVTTRFPGRALVEISERTPVVWYIGDDQKARVVDARGHVIAVLAGWPTKYLQVRGIGPSLKAGAIADDSYRAAAQLVIALPEEIRPKVKFMELTGGGELSMVLSGGTLVRFGPPTGLQDKLVSVVVLLRRQNPSTLAVIDVSTGEPTVQTR